MLVSVSFPRYRDALSESRYFDNVVIVNSYCSRQSALSSHSITSICSCSGFVVDFL